MSKPGTCTICKKETTIQEHHIIPRCVHKELKIENKPEISQQTIEVCKPCHKILHNAFYYHIGNPNNGYQKIRAIKHVVMKDYIEKRHRPVIKEFNEYWKSFIQKAREEFE